MEIHNLRGRSTSGYTTWGCMWNKGECSGDTDYVCENERGEYIPLQTRTTAWWPDGSVKWTAHTADSALMGEKAEVRPGKYQAKEREGIRIFREQSDRVTDDKSALKPGERLQIQAGTLSLSITEGSNCLFDRAELGGKSLALNAHPVLMIERPFQDGIQKGCLQKEYGSHIDKVTLEEQGHLMVIIQYEGIHEAADGERLLPFVIRMKIGFDSSRIDFTHTFLYDGEEDRDYLKGLGIRFSSPIDGAMYNRHIKFTLDQGVFHECPVQLLSWHPRIPARLYELQRDGKLLLPEEQDRKLLDQFLEDVPFWSEFDLCQDSVSHFAVKKKIRDDNCCYIDGFHGLRTDGGAAFGSACGSVMMAIRDFWEKYPSGYTIRGLDSHMVQADIWFWSPGAQAFDFRHYANRGYNQVCYEGYDYKGATPYGIACTNECSIMLGSEMIPDDDTLYEFVRQVKKPSVYVGSPRYYHDLRAFGYWSLPSHDTQMECWLEDQMEKAFEFYKNEVEQRGWYGMFNYGDFMHTYDAARHQWRYDMGGYAWDNTELVPTLWLWLYFMRTGREDVFELAEKLSRHCSEVDVYHMGPYKGLGSRHNVRHWGCPCKEARIAMAAHHRYYYYLTGDRRLEDIFGELKDNEMSFLNKDPLGDFYQKEEMVYPSHARSGPDWSSLCSNWMTEWERFGDTRYRDKILTGIEDIKAAPLKLSSGPDFEFDPETVHLRYIGERTTGGCHLQVCMGAPQVWMEMGDLLEDEEWKRMMADYGRFYYLPREQQLEESKGLIGDREFSLPFMAAAMGAYGAAYLEDNWLAARTWEILLQTLISDGNHEGFALKEVKKECGRETLWEIPWISTNFTAQWCLNTIVVLEFIRKHLPLTLDETDRLVQGMDTVAFRKA